MAYESVLVGLFTIFRGKFCPLGGNLTAEPPAPLVNRTGEWDSVFVGYSRDGFHWHRPVDSEGLHRVFLDMDSTPVKCTAHAGCDWRWNKAAVQSVGGAFTVQNQATDQTMRFCKPPRLSLVSLIAPFQRCQRYHCGRRRQRAQWQGAAGLERLDGGRRAPEGRLHVSLRRRIFGRAHHPPRAL